MKVGCYRLVRRVKFSEGCCIMCVGLQLDVMMPVESTCLWRVRGVLTRVMWFGEGEGFGEGEVFRGVLRGER